MICPHCGFTNKPIATRCECCLGDLADASVAPLMDTQSAAEAATEPEPGSPLPPSEVPPPASPSDMEEQPAPATLAEPSRVPAPSPHVPRAATAVIIGLVVLGALGGLWLMRSRLGSSQLLSERLGISSKPEAAQPSEPAAPASPTEVAPTDPATDAPLETSAEPGAEQPPSLPLSTETVPAVSPEDKAAEARYQRAVNSLSRGQPTHSRRMLQEIIRKYPNNRFAEAARDLLQRTPKPRPAPARSPTVVARATRPSARTRRQAPGPVADPSESANEGKRSVITTDDLLEGRGGARTTRRRKQTSIPPSLRAAQARPVQGASAAARNDVRLISATRQPGKVVLLVQYHLVSRHQRPVLVGAWALGGGSARNFGYSASPIAPGRGTTTVTLSGVSPNLSRLRIAFIEQGGQRFFTKDLTVPK